MFDHRALELLHELHAKQDRLMATLSDLQAAQAATTQAITDLATRISQLPAPAATAADLDTLVATAQAQTAALNAIDPAQGAPAPTAG